MHARAALDNPILPTLFANHFWRRKRTGRQPLYPILLNAVKATEVQISAFGRHWSVHFRIWRRARSLKRSLIAVRSGFYSDDAPISCEERRRTAMPGTHAVSPVLV